MWKRHYAFGGDKKRDNTDHIDYYYNDKGYVIKPIFIDWRHNKICGYSLVNKKGMVLNIGTKLSDVKFFYNTNISGEQ